MSTFQNRIEWNTYVEAELAGVTPWLTERGYTLEAEQPHISGERYLMSGRKLVLLATDENGVRVVVKVSSDRTGRDEIRTERERQQTLHRLPFAYYTFRSPEEYVFQDGRASTIYITEFIEQPDAFLTLPLKQQFFIALDAFKTFAGIHATTYAHAKTIAKTFGVLHAPEYIERLTTFQQESSGNDAVQRVLERFIDTPETIERYCNFLVHEDFALHNVRIKDGQVYLIDYASLQFGNKHETWARFLNFMLLYNRDLEQALMQYARDNQAPEELASLSLMRAFKACQLVGYHSRSAAHSSGALQELSQVRINFWADVATHNLATEPVPTERITAYTTLRDQLRSDEEWERQRALQQSV